MPYLPRERRDRDRIRRAALAAKGRNAPAMEVALAQIGAGFDQAAIINGFKIRVARYLRLAPDHPTLRARFGTRAASLSGRSLEEAIASIERRWRDERRAFQIASALGCGSRLSVEVLSELRLMLRLMRFKHMEREFCRIIMALCDEALAIAAE